MAISIEPIEEILSLGVERTPQLYRAGWRAVDEYVRTRRNPVGGVGYALGRRAALHTYFGGADDRDEFLLARRAAIMLLKLLSADDDEA